MSLERFLSNNFKKGAPLPGSAPVRVHSEYLSPKLISMCLFAKLNGINMSVPCGPSPSLDYLHHTKVVGTLSYELG